MSEEAQRGPKLPETRIQLKWTENSAREWLLRAFVDLLVFVFDAVENVVDSSEQMSWNVSFFYSLIQETINSDYSTPNKKSSKKSSNKNISRWIYFNRFASHSTERKVSKRE